MKASAKILRLIVGVIDRIGARKGYMVCFCLLVVGSTCAFSRFFSNDKMTGNGDDICVQFAILTDTIGVQSVSAVLFILAGFVFAIVAGSMKGRNSDVSSGCGISVDGVNKFGYGDWPFSSAGRLGAGEGRLQRSSDRVVQSLHRPGAEDSGEPKCLDNDSSRPEMGATGKVEFEVVDFRKQLADKRFSNETRSFLEDRLEGLIIESPLNDDRILEWGQSAVSMIDELVLLRAHISDEDLRVVDFVCGCICDKMKEMNLALIDKDTWDSSCQRAVSVVRSETAVETKILRKKACGMTFKGKVIKKQEVDVEMPFAQ